MRRTILSTAVCGVFLVPGIGAAEESPHTFSGNVGLYSQYIFRGLAQTNEEPALQGGLDYAHSSGLYLGLWGSNVSWPKENFTVGPPKNVSGQYSDGGSLEVDFYGGMRGPIGSSDFTYDVGLLYYWYPGTVTSGCTIGTASCPEADTFEAYGALGWKWLSVKYSYSFGDTFGWPGADGTWYLDFGASIPLGETGLTLGLHYGIQDYSGKIRGTSISYDDLLSYNDWRVSLAYDLGRASKTFAGVEIGAMYTDTSGANDCGYGSYKDTGSVGGAPCVGPYPKNIADGQFTAWIKKSF